MRLRLSEINALEVFFSLIKSQTLLDVSDYGAVANDGNDDIGEINAAINASTAGDTIYFPSGMFHISDAIRLKSYTIMIGDGQDNSTIRFIGSNFAPIFGLYPNIPCGIQEELGTSPPLSNKGSRDRSME